MGVVGRWKIEERRKRSCATPNRNDGCKKKGGGEGWEDDERRLKQERRRRGGGGAKREGKGEGGKEKRVRNSRESTQCQIHGSASRRASNGCTGIIQGQWTTINAEVSIVGGCTRRQSDNTLSEELPYSSTMVAGRLQNVGKVRVPNEECLELMFSRMSPLSPR